MAVEDFLIREKRAELSRRIIAICPNCKTPIRGEDLFRNKNFLKQFGESKNFPIGVRIPCPSHKDRHIKLYVDANLSVRDFELE